MKAKHSFFLTATLLAGAALAASAQNETPQEVLALPSDSVVVVPRTYMGQTVNAIEPKNLDLGKDSWWSKVRATGAIQTDFVFRVRDTTDKDQYTDKVLNNTYFDLTINAPYISVGGRFEWAKWPLPGYADDFKGWGVPYVWATGRYKCWQLTAGDFYEQFGSGLILRTYQERSLGVDNAIRGGRFKINPAKGVMLTALGGKQRRYWEHNSAWLWGADAQWSLDETFHKAFGNDYGLNLGFSYVGKHDDYEVIYTPDFQYKANVPTLVAAFDARANVRLKNVSVLAEFATRSQDPSTTNKYLYRQGTAALLSLTYAANGFTAFVQAKRTDDMGFRSKRQEVGVSSFINNLPAFTMTQTYALAAMYPYSTQTDGEWAFQADLRYLFKKKTPLGGKYGTSVRLSASYISGLDRPSINNYNTEFIGTEGPCAFWKIGQLYYADLNFELNKKLSSKFQFTFFYLFQKYNQQIVELHGEDMVTANTFIFEGQWKIRKKTQLRFEVQYLTTKEDKGDWVAALVELSLAPHWMFTVSDEFNISKTKANDYKRTNYYKVGVTYNLKANRFQLSYGRTRDGYNCSGGVCRYVPAYTGFSLSYNYTF